MNEFDDSRPGYRFYVHRDGTLARKRVLDDDRVLLGLGQILRKDGWVYYFLAPYDIREIDAPSARERAADADVYAPVAGASGDHLEQIGYGQAIVNDLREIENVARREGRELTLEEAREAERMMETLRERYELAEVLELAEGFSQGTPLPAVEVPEDTYRPTVRLGFTGGDHLIIGGTVEGTLTRAEAEGTVPAGTAEVFRREGMPPPFGEAPMVEYREMLRHLLGVAARYVEIEDGYPERPDEGDQASEGHEAELAEHALEILLEDQLQRDAQRAGLEPDPGEEWRRRWRAGERAMIERLRDEGDLESFAKALVQREFKVRLVRREDERP